jgi:CheY-like chemotaxis protein
MKRSVLIADDEPLARRTLREHLRNLGWVGPIRKDVLEFFLVCTTLLVPCMAQIPRVPNIESQRAAMRRLSFLTGIWSGEARVLRGSGEPQQLVQTEEAQYKLDGLVLMIEGIGRTKSDGKLALQALGIVSYDDESEVYRMRAYNDGRYLETELKLSNNGKEILWGFEFGEIKTNSVLRINEKGEWTELTEITIGSQPPRKFMELTVRPQK